MDNETLRKALEVLQNICLELDRFNSFLGTDDFCFDTGYIRDEINEIRESITKQEETE